MHQTTRKHLQRAAGYRELGMLEDAHDEVERTLMEDRFSREVLVERLLIYEKMEQWDLVAGVARQLAADHPDEPDWWIQWAYGTRRHKGLGDGIAILEDAMKRFPNNATVTYYLGSYSSVAGDMEAAWELVKEAIGMDKAFQKVAIEDDDLEPLWDSL
jgi:lipopolysaccharide biosynthesis regulator YciM